MQPEHRIGFGIAIDLPCVILIILRAWVLSRYTRAPFGNSVTNAALYLTLLCVIATNGCNTWISAKLIEYRHVNVPREQSTGLPFYLVKTALKISVALKCFYVVGLYAVKAAFLGIFVELEQYLEKRLKVFVMVAVWVTVAAFVANFLLTMLWCLPLHTNWSTDPKTLCSSLRSIVVVGFGTVTNILTDIAIMAIPLFVLKTLPLHPREMYAIAFILFLGFICIVASIVRFIFLCDFIYGDNHKTLPSQQNVIAYTSELEVGIAVWAGCLPALRALLRRPSRNRASVSESGIPPSMFSNTGANGEPRPRSSNALAVGSSRSFSPQPIHPGHRESRTELQLPSGMGNPILARGFGYGEYDPERDAVEAVMRRHSSRYQISRVGNREKLSDGDGIDHKFSLDSEQDASEGELRNFVPLSPPKFSRTRGR